MDSERHRFFNVEFSFRYNKVKEILSWDILFGNKIVRVHSHLLDSFPAELVDLPTLAYLLVYDLDNNTKQQLENCP